MPSLQPRVFLHLLAAMAVCLCPPVAAQDAPRVELSSGAWTVVIDPTTLAVTARPQDKSPVQVSAPQEGLGRLGRVTRSADEVSWEMEDAGCSVSFRLAEDTLSVRFRSITGGEITWPLIGHGDAVLAYLLPLSEGSYVPASDAEWLSFLVEASPMSTTEGLSMPFLGLDCGDYTISYLLTDPCHNALVFYQHEGRIAARLTHEFVTHEFGSEQPEDFGFVIRLGPSSPVEPAASTADGCSSEESSSASTTRWRGPLAWRSCSELRTRTFGAAP